MRRRAGVVALLLCSLFVPFSLSGQEKQEPPEAAESAEPSSSDSSSRAAAPADAKPSPVTLRTLPMDVLRDQRRFWLSPLHIRREQAPWLLATAGVTGVLIATDHPVAKSLSDSPPGNGHLFGEQVGRFSGGLYDLAVAAGFYLFGKMRHDAHAQETGELGMRALVDTLILVQSFKTFSQRQRPARRNGTPLENSQGEFLEGGRSFPSGHAAEAWALATVVAHQYRHRKWVPPVAYGLAGVVAFSRIPARKHFPSDAFIGSVLGFAVGRSVWRVTRLDEKTPQKVQFVPYAPQGGGFGFAVGVSF